MKSTRSPADYEREIEKLWADYPVPSRKAGLVKSLEQQIQEQDQKLRRLREIVGKMAGANAKGKEHRQPVELVESYKALGLSEQEARIAASVEHAVENTQESQRTLYNTAKSLGFTDSEAEAFAQPRRPARGL